VVLGSFQPTGPDSATSNHITNVTRTHVTRSSDRAIPIATSAMGSNTRRRSSPTRRCSTTHLVDTDQLYQDIRSRNLPATSFVKPGGWIDGNPASSKLLHAETMIHVFVVIYGVLAGFCHILPFRLLRIKTIALDLQTKERAFAIAFA
jgi:hypothetical protein